MFRPIYAFSAIAAVVGSATAEFVTIQAGNQHTTYTIEADLVGTSGSLTSFAIEDVPQTWIVGGNEKYQLAIDDGESYGSQECSTGTSSSIKCKLYYSEKDSGSASVETISASFLDDEGVFVLSYSATETGVHSQTTTQTATASTTPSSATAVETGSRTSTSTGLAQETSSSAAAAHLAMNGLWIGSSFAALLAVL